MNLKEAKVLWLEANEAYHNTGETIMSDAKFDALEKYIIGKDPDWKELKKTGAQVGKKEEVALLEYMPSLLKAYPKDLPKFLARIRATLVLMDKLDGSSLQVAYENGKLWKIITRGDGTDGKDITFLAEYLNIPKRISTKVTTVFRCEALMKKATFEKRWSRKARGDRGFDNGRNMVNGILNRTVPHVALKDVDIVALGVYGKPLAEGLKFAEKAGFTVAWNKMTGVAPTKILADRKANSDYEIDGLVIAPFDFMYAYKNADKPKLIFAYKENDEANAKKAKVLDIIYQISGFGRITPKAKIEPTEVDGVIVQHATLSNGTWMQENKVGVGATVSLVRSGGVIPKIVGSDGKGKIKFPEYEYKVVGRDFRIVKFTKEQAIRILERFVEKLGIEGVKAKSLSALYDVKLRTPADLVKLATGPLPTAAKYLHFAGFGKVQTVNIMKELHRVLRQPVPVIALMNASGCFELGVGERKLNKLAAETNLLKLMRKKESVAAAEIAEIKGFGEITGELIASGLVEFAEWLDSFGDTITVEKPKKAKVIVGKLNGQRFAWTGYRSKDEEAFITAAGGTVDKFNKKTTTLFYSPDGKASKKVEAFDGATTFAKFKKENKL